MKLPEGLDLAKIRTFPIFQDLTETELHGFLDGTYLSHYAADASILKQGDPPQGLGILLSGKAKVYRVGEHGEHHFLTVLKEGDFFGEMALVSPGVRSASLDAIETSEVVWMSSTDFHRELESSSPRTAKILTRMVADLSHRLRLLGERYVYMKENMHRRG